MRYSTIGVVGAGTIGTGVAQALAQTGHSVTLLDVSTQVLEDAIRKIAAALKSAALFDPALRNAPHAVILDRVSTTTDFAELAKSDLVIENATESWSVKEPIYRSLDRTCAGDCVIAANTSAISIARLASATRREDRVLGVHFMNPVTLKPVVEVIRARHTSDATIGKAMELLQQMGKTGILVNDMPGFVSNRVLMVTINEAIFVLQDRVAESRDIDAIFVQCCSHKMGPLATADLIGLDTVLRTLDVLFESYQDAKYLACPLLRNMVNVGLLGRKTGKGFFDYDYARRVDES
jgi:3-hydroxybutyryl-CoA dehydrogenase